MRLDIRNFNFRVLKDVIINFLNSANTPFQVYLRFGVMSLFVLVPCFLITMNRIYSYSGYKKASLKELDSIEINKVKIMDLANIATEILEQEETTKKKDVYFLTDLGKLAEETGNEIIRFKPLPKRIVTVGENIDAFPVEIELLGGFTTLVNFLEQVKKYDRICTVEKMEIKTSKLSYPYIESSLGLVLFPFLNDKTTFKDSVTRIKNDPFKPFYYDKGEISVTRKTGDITLTGIIKEKERWAIIEVGAKRYIVKKGDSIGGDIKITNITADAVYLIRKGKEIRLNLAGK